MMHEQPKYEEPPETEQAEGNTLYCFLDAGRICDMSCVSYLPARPEGKDYENQAFSCCSLLVSAHRGGKHLTVLAQLGADFLRHNRIRTADATREANSPVAPVRGG